MGGDAATVLEDFRLMETAATRLGLEMNDSKCEVVGHTDVTRALFVSHGISLPDTSQSIVILLGAPVSRSTPQRGARRLEIGAEFVDKETGVYAVTDSSSFKVSSEDCNMY